MTKLAWLKSTSYPGMWLMVAQGLVKDWRKRKLAIGFVSFSKYKIPCKLAQNFSKCQRVYRDFVLRKI